MNLDLDPMGRWLRERGWFVDFAPDPRNLFTYGERIRIVRTLSDGRRMGWWYAYEVPMKVEYRRVSLFRWEPLLTFDDDAWTEVRRTWLDRGTAEVEHAMGVPRDAVQAPPAPLPVS